MEYRKYFTWSTLYNQASITDYYELKTSFSAQLTNTNLFKAGFEYWLMDQNYNASSSLVVSAFVWRTGFASNYKAKTWYASGYVQDKLEFAGMVANIGTRVDAYNFGVDAPANRFAIFYPGEPSDSLRRGIPEWRDSKTFYFVSPRLGVSFPIGEKTAFRIQYGHFRSMPINNRALDNQTYNGWGSYGNPNLEPKLSVNYEVGVQQNLWNTHQLDVVTYYNDLKNQVGTIYIKSYSGSSTRSGDFIRGAVDLEDIKHSYVSYDNNGYGHSRGLEISFRNRDSEKIKYFFSYALSQTTYGNFGTQIIGIDLDTGEEISDDLKQKYQYPAADFLAAEDRTHKFNSSVTYNFKENDGPDMFGLYPLSNTSFSLIYRVSSGLAYYYSPEFQSNIRVESNRRYPIESQTDLRIEKNFKIQDFNFKFGVRVINLFDNKHFTPVSSTEALERWVQRSVSAMDKDYDAYGNEIPISQRGETVYNYFQTFKNIPRQIFFSLGVTF
jgi:outer membrane receptor protein involved in Fe transport